MSCGVQVTVTGAGGRTGKLIMQKLLAQPDKFTARAVVRDEKVCQAPLLVAIPGKAVVQTRPLRSPLALLFSGKVCFHTQTGDEA